MPFRDKSAKAEYDRQYREKHAERLREQSRRYYEENREELIAKARDRTDPVLKARYDFRNNQRPEVRARRAVQRRAWNGANAEQAWVHNRERSLARRNARPDAEGKEYMAVLYGDPCVYCGRPADHIDHIVPLKSKGTSAWDNLTASCQDCNYAKRIKSLLVFLATR